MGDHGQPSRCLGVWRGGPEQRHRRTTGSRARRRSVAQDWMAAQADHRFCQLGCGGGRPDGLDRVRRAAPKELSRAVAYFNMDAAVSGPDFGASSVPSLKQYLRDVAKSVASPKGGSVYDQWKAAAEKKEQERAKPPEPESSGAPAGEPPATVQPDVRVGNLGSGSDYTAFLQHRSEERRAGKA